ncbi:MAG: hypothetical protein JWP20_778 [Roseomonas sp.]|nr:hypothetical protein [Roseomonas sp.]
MLYLNGNAFRARIEGGWASTQQVDRYAKLAPDTMLKEIKAAWGMGKAGVRPPPATEAKACRAGQEVAHS